MTLLMAIKVKKKKELRKERRKDDKHETIIAKLRKQGSERGKKKIRITMKTLIFIIR